MCGIVGHLGPQNSVNLVLEGLKRLEYRGYDSAGVAFIDEHDDLQVYKKSGKLENLMGMLEGKKLVARSCIGHTRWATHGEVSDTNSHPHMKRSVSIVHNGIIENHQELKDELLAEGAQFESDTDSEVFLGLITYYMDQKMSLVDSICKSFERIQGNSAFVILDSKDAQIWSIKRGAPLVCGINEVSSEVLVCSDPYALVGMVDKLYFPEDNVLCSLSAANKNLLNFYELNGDKSNRYFSKVQDMSLSVSDKGSYEHFMLKEIHEQPELIRSLVQFYFGGEGEEVLKGVENYRPDRIHLTACGTAYYSAMLVREYIERYNRIPSIVELASEFRYREPILGDNDLGLFVSQSGETADTLAAQTLCKENKLKTFSILNVEGSTLFRESDVNLMIRAGTEIGVASTKAFTQMCLTGRLLSLAMSGDLANSDKKNKLSHKFSLLAERVDALLADTSSIEKIAADISHYLGFFFTGRGNYFPIALEGALKLKEIAYVHAEGYAAGELKHGPIALIDEKMVNIAIIGPELYEKSVSNMQEIKARKGVIVTIGPEGDKSLESLSDFYIPLNFEGLEELSPIFANVVNQLLSYYIAKTKGTDIDKPRNLAKSVTVE
jgi:glucosamine--fructose-6-phosphate aminotransferase (isomerizing)